MVTTGSSLSGRSVTAAAAAAAAACPWRRSAGVAPSAGVPPPSVAPVKRSRPALGVCFHPHVCPGGTTAWWRRRLAVGGRAAAAAVSAPFGGGGGGTGGATAAPAAAVAPLTVVRRRQACTAALSLFPGRSTTGTPRPSAAVDGSSSGGGGNVRGADGSFIGGEGLGSSSGGAGAAGTVNSGDGGTPSGAPAAAAAGGGFQLHLPHLDSLRSTLGGDTPASEPRDGGAPPGGGSDAANGGNGDGGTGGGGGAAGAVPDVWEEPMLAPSDAPTLVKVVTYNVLSSSLAPPSRFCHCDAANLHAPTRLSRLVGKLRAPLAARAVICLQEVSEAWASPLHTLFAAHGYHFVVSLYGASFNGYMGVGVAVPMDTFDITDTALVRVTQGKAWPRPPLPPVPFRFFVDAVGRLRAAWRALTTSSLPPVADGGDGGGASPSVGSFPSLGGAWAFLSGRPAKGGSSGSGSTNGGGVTSKTTSVTTSALRLFPPPLRRPSSFDPWSYTEHCRNVLVATRLRCRANGAAVTVATYHMPCVFWSPPAMVINTALMSAAFHQLVPPGEAGIMAGDLNIKPGDAAYRLLTTGGLPRGDAAYPHPRAHDPWRPDVPAPLASAYVRVWGREPGWTNYAQIGEAPPFVETLDYVLVTPGVDVVDVLPTPEREAVGGPLPTAAEPSDHILIGATVRLPPPSPVVTEGLSSAASQTDGVPAAVSVAEAGSSAASRVVRRRQAATAMAV
ncbi:hypothetical protein MMPV_005829 [Pyropia vietnamensis]